MSEYKKTTIALYKKATEVLFKEASSGITLAKARSILRENQADSMKIIEVGNRLSVFKTIEGGKIISASSMTAEHAGQLIEEHFSKSKENNRINKEKTLGRTDAANKRYTEFFEDAKKRKKLTYTEIVEMTSKYKITSLVSSALKKMKFLNTDTNTVQTKYQSMSSKKLIGILRNELKSYKAYNKKKTDAKPRVETARTSLTPDLQASAEQKLKLAKLFSQRGEYSEAIKLLEGK